MVEAADDHPRWPRESRPGRRQLFNYLANKYGYDKAAAEAAPARIAEILRALTARLEAQRKRGSRFFIGDTLSALDIYWATFAAMNNPPSSGRGVSSRCSAWWRAAIPTTVGLAGDDSGKPSEREARRGCISAAFPGPSPTSKRPSS